jgi:hypothetical protein
MMKATILAILVAAFGCNQKKKEGSAETAAKVEPAGKPAPTAVAPAEEPPSQQKQRPERPHLKRGQPLPAPVRTALRQIMTDHGDDMESLLWSALMLDYESTEAIADRMVSSPSFSRPGPGSEGTLNEHMPAAFFELQDELEKATANLRKAANEKDDAAMASEYSNVARTCISCHSLYLKVPGAE